MTQLENQMLDALKAIYETMIGDRTSENVMGPAGIACDKVRAAIALAEAQSAGGGKA